jgi:hypothetical protein
MPVCKPIETGARTYGCIPRILRYTGAGGVVNESQDYIGMCRLQTEELSY